MSKKFILTLVVFISLLKAETLQLMPLGDSITYDHKKSDISKPRPAGKRTGYRSHLWYMLEEAQVAVNFVGSQVAGQSIEPAFDPDNEGHEGWTSYDISNSVYRFLSANHADTILLHIGTNDNSADVSGVVAILDDINRYEKDTGRNVRVLLAMIIARTEVANVTIDNFNSNIYNLAQRRINSGDMITLVDMYRGAGLIASDYADITHPNDSGYQKMATVWFNTLMQPYNVSLHSYAHSVVSGEYIRSVSIDEVGASVEFVTQVPNFGITF